MDGVHQWADTNRNCNTYSCSPSSPAITLGRELCKYTFKPTFNPGKNFKVVLQGFPRCPDSHDLRENHHLQDLGRHTNQKKTYT